MDYTDQASPPAALEPSMQVKQTPTEEKLNNIVLDQASTSESPLTIVIGLPELESPLSPLSTPSPSIRIDDMMSDVSTLSPYTPFIGMSPTTSTPQQTPVRDCEYPSGLSPHTSALSLDQFTQSPGGCIPRIGYRAKAKGLHFKLSSLSPNSGPPLLSPVDAFRQQEVFPLPSPMARDLRRRAEANEETVEMDITTSDGDDSYGFDAGYADTGRNNTLPESSCLGLDLGLSPSRGNNSTPDVDSYLSYGTKAREEKEAIGVNRESGVEEFRAQIMQATLVHSASAELVSSPEKSHNRHLDSVNGCEGNLRALEKTTPKRSAPLPESHLKSPFFSLSPTKQRGDAYTLAALSQPSTPSSSDGMSPKYDTRKIDSSTSPSYSRLFGTGSPSPAPKRRHTNGFDLTQARMQGHARFPERFSKGDLLETQFAQHYVLETELGSGGYGFVLSARSRMTGEAVAVKFIIRNQIPTHGLVKDHNNRIVPLEAVALQLARHSGVVEFRGLYKDNVYFYLVQELHGSPWSKNSKNQHKLDQESTTSTPKAQEQYEVSHSKPQSPVSPYAPTQSSPLRKFAPSLSMPNVPTLSFPATRELGPRQSLPLLARPMMPRRASYDLFECIEQHERLSEGQAKYIFAQVVDTVRYLDMIGITHRDIKDENLVIDKDFKVKVIDFGSAVIRDVRQPPPTYTRFFGTVTFASPEILKEQPYTAPPAEVWTLGILLSFLVTGQSPFPTPEHAKHGVMCELNASIVVSPLCRDLMYKCLEPNPALRITVHQVRGHPWLRGALDRA